MLGARGIEAAQQSVDQGAGLQQLRKATQAAVVASAGAVVRSGCLGPGRRLQVGPLGRNERTALVRQDQQQLQTTAVF